MLCHGGGCKVLTSTNLTVMCENFSIKVCHVRCRKKLSSSSTPAACSHQHFLWQKVLARNSAMQWQVIAKISQRKQQSIIFHIKEKEVYVMQSSSSKKKGTIRWVHISKYFGIFSFACQIRLKLSWHSNSYLAFSSKQIDH